MKIKTCQMLVLLLLPTLLLLTVTSLVTAHVGEGEEWLLVPYFSGDLRLERSHFAPQWDTGREVDVKSAGGQEISMVALNNGTHIYYHVRWADRTYSRTEDDGVAIYFEGAGINGSDSVWVWSASSSLNSGAGVQTAALWKDDYWNVVFGRTLAAPAEGTANLTVSESKEGFVKVAAWDGSEGQSFSQIDPETLPHLNLYILPYIDYYPKESFVWLPILGLGLLVFTYKELKVSGWRRKK